MQRYGHPDKVLKVGVSVGCFFFALALAVATPLSAQDVPLIRPLKVYDRPAKRLVDDNGDVSTNISGIACLRPKENTRHCLVIDDEGQRGQIARLDEDGLTGTDHQPRLISEDANPPPVGAAPEDLACSAGEGKFKDLDGEAVAYSQPFYYIIGSHGCSRHHDRFHASAFLLVRLPVDDTGHKAGEPQATYRLSEAIKNSRVGTYFGRGLNAANGLNIEGLAVVGDSLYAGLRAPSLEKNAFILRVSVSALFGVRPLPDKTEVWSVKLGQDVGIRDLATLEDGRFLILGGPAQQQNMPSSVFLTEGGFGSSALPLATLESVPAKEGDAKAEAILPLSVRNGVLRFLILFDGLKNGGGREYEVKLP